MLVSPHLVTQCAMPVLCSYIVEKEEEEEGLPALISCAGCGRSVQWRSEQIHKHKRLDVLICQVQYTQYITLLP